MLTDQYGHELGERSPKPDFDASAIASENERALKELGDGGELPFWSLGELVLIGPAHPGQYYDWITEPMQGCAHGTVKIEKGGVFSPGSLTFTVTDGHADRREIEDHIAQFSKKEVIWA